MKKHSKSARYAKYQEHAKWIERNIRIRKSQIVTCGGGAFVNVNVKRGGLLGHYKGCRVKFSELSEQSEEYDYIMDGESGGRNAYDPDGRLQLMDGTEVDVHGWSMEDWKQLQQDGVKWTGKVANWTRFINHASGDFRNCSICNTNERFGRSHAIYALRDIKAGEELFYSYGNAYFLSRGYEAAEPKIV